MELMPSAEGDWNLKWNAENRLIEAKSADTRVRFVYDYMGRRIEKRVYKTPSNWTLESRHRYIYNNFRLVQTIDATDPANLVVEREFVWSLNDQLRMVIDTPAADTYFVHHDANRNVVLLTDTAGEKAAHYEYAPFGAITAQSGHYADENPFRFSSEQFDNSTGLVYYNYRYYSPELGRWLNRDPIEERGGLNLYGFVGNDGINSWDVLGLSFVNFGTNFNSFDWGEIQWEGESKWRYHSEGLTRTMSRSGTRTGIGWRETSFRDTVRSYYWDGECCWRNTWRNHVEIGVDLEQGVYQHFSISRSILNRNLDRVRIGLEVTAACLTFGKSTAALYAYRHSARLAGRKLWGYGWRFGVKKLATHGTKEGMEWGLGEGVTGGWVEDPVISDINYHTPREGRWSMQNIHLHFQGYTLIKGADEAECNRRMNNNNVREQVKDRRDFEVNSVRCHGAEDSKGGCPL